MSRNSNESAKKLSMPLDKSMALTQEKISEFEALMTNIKDVIAEVNEWLAWHGYLSYGPKATADIKTIDQAVKNVAEFLEKQASILSPEKQDELLAQFTPLKAESLQVFHKLADQWLAYKQKSASTCLTDIETMLTRAKGGSAESDLCLQAIEHDSQLFEERYLDLDVLYDDWTDVAQDVKDVIFDKVALGAADFRAKHEALRQEIDAFTALRARVLSYTKEMRELVIEATQAVQLFEEQCENKDLYAAAVNAVNKIRDLGYGNSKGKPLKVINLPGVRDASNSLGPYHDWENYQIVADFDYVSPAIRAIKEAARQAKLGSATGCLVLVNIQEAYSAILKFKRYFPARDLFIAAVTACKEVRELKEEENVELPADFEERCQNYRDVNDYASVIAKFYPEATRAVSAAYEEAMQILTDALAHITLYEPEDPEVLSAYQNALDKLDPNGIFRDVMMRQPDLYQQMRDQLTKHYTDYESAIASEQKKQAQAQGTRFIDSLAAQSNRFNEKIAATSAIHPDAIALFLDQLNPEIQTAQSALATAQKNPLVDVFFRRLEEAKAVITSSDVNEFITTHEADARIISLKTVLQTFMGQHKRFHDVRQVRLQRADATATASAAPAPADQRTSSLWGGIMNCFRGSTRPEITRQDRHASRKELDEHLTEHSL